KYTSMKGRWPTSSLESSTSPSVVSMRNGGTGCSASMLREGSTALPDKANVRSISRESEWDAQPYALNVRSRIEQPAIVRNNSSIVALLSSIAASRQRATDAPDIADAHVPDTLRFGNATGSASQVRERI